MSNKILSKILIIFFVGFCALILAFSMRGNLGNPSSSELNNAIWQVDGPFELSPERGRFALTYSLVEDHSFQFSNNIGKFATPDVALSHGRYVSLFAPLLSFVTIPGYIVGKYLGVSQVGTFAMVAVFALFNVVLLRAIVIRLGGHPVAATIASFIFLFATPAFAYAVDLYQHHLSIFLILLSIYVLLRSNKAWALAVAFLSCAAAIPLDYPNLFFMAPIGIYAVGRIISFENIHKSLSVKINIFKILTPFVMILPIILFLWFNQASYGNAFQLSGTLPSAKAVQNTHDLASISAAQNEGDKKSAIGFFKTRSILNGLYIHFISPDRGIVYYAPVILFGILGFALSLKKKVKMVPLLAAIVGANILLYSMWGDPWGGWAFGSRYLIPSYAILSIFVGLLLTYWSKKIWFLVIFVLVAFYSIAVNALGAITTSAVPPQLEVLNLEKISGQIQKYSFDRNWQFLTTGHSKSFVYQTFLQNYLSPLEFYQILLFSLFIVVGGVLVYYVLISKKGGVENA